MDLERYTVKSREALDRAQRIARDRSHQELRPEHLLAALLEDRAGTAHAVLQKLGVDAAALVRANDAGLASLPRVALGSLGYLAVAGLVDWLLGANYGFLRAKPAGQNLLTMLSDWPWYIPQIVAIGFVFVGLYYLPFLVADLVRRKAQEGPERT